MSPEGQRSICIVLPNLAGGGAEAMRLRLAAEFIEHDFDVEFVLISQGGDLIDLTPDGVKVTSLNATGALSTIWRLTKHLRKRQPDAVLGAMWALTVFTILAHRLAGCGGSVVVSDHEILSNSAMGRRPLFSRLMGMSIRLFYPLATARIAVSNGAADDLSAVGGLSRGSIEVVYNPAFVPDVKTDLRARNVHNPARLLAVGKFKREKNFSLLLDAMARLVAIRPAVLTILGDGPLRGDLEGQIEKLGLSDVVLLPGFSHDTASAYRRTDVFVMSSLSEGFGNVLVEALQYGVPVVSTDCPSGPREILADGEFGKLVPCGDAEALVKAILQSLDEKPDRRKLAARAAEFSSEKIALQYLEAMFPGEGWADREPHSSGVI